MFLASLSYPVSEVSYFNNQYASNTDSFDSPMSYENFIEELYYHTPRGSFRSDYNGKYGSYYEGITSSYYDGSYGSYYYLGLYDDGYAYDSSFDASQGYTKRTSGNGMGNYYNGNYGSYYVGAYGEYYDGKYGAYYDGTNDYSIYYDSSVYGIEIDSYYGEPDGNLGIINQNTFEVFPQIDGPTECESGSYTEYIIVKNHPTCDIYDGSYFRVEDYNGLPHFATGNRYQHLYLDDYLFLDNTGINKWVQNYARLSSMFSPYSKDETNINGP